MDIFLLSGARTPNGSFMGSLSSLSATQLGSFAIEAAVKKSGVAKEDVDEVFMGQVVQAGAGQAPARQAAIGAGLPNSVPCTTINKVCGSGMQALIFAYQSLQLGDNNLVIAGGMESMSQAPFLLMNGRKGLRFGTQELKDAVQWDGLWDVYTQRAMGSCAEECAEKYSLTREEQDAYSSRSFQRAKQAIKEKFFENEIVPIKIKNSKGIEEIIQEDEGPKAFNPEKMPLLKPVFKSGGTITPANASTLNDGAVSLVLANTSYIKKQKLNPSFKIIAHAKHAAEPTWFTTAPLSAIKKVLEKSQLSLEDIGLWEINEAFSLVPLFVIKELKVNPEKVNIYGGAVSLGHPIGNSGARIVLSLMNAMKREKIRYGLAAICIGGGEALSMVIEQIV